MIPAVKRTRVSHSRSVVPPTGGLDAGDAWAAMPEDRAIKMLNWFPDTDRVTLRAGSITRIDDMPTRVETIMTYTGNTGAQKLFAASGTAIYDVTPNAITATSVVTGMTNSRWEYVNYGTLGGQFLIAVNGADNPRLYDGTTWSTTAITGPAQSTFTWVTPHQRRLWFGVTDSMTVYYLAVDAIAGAATAFYLGGVAHKGGYIQAMGTWTRDSGAGADDVAVFMTSEGELLIYHGTNPSDVATWYLVGVFDVGKPIGKRCMVKFGGDLILITELGVLPMTTASQTEKAQQNLIAYSKRVNRLVNDAIHLYGTLYGWQPVIHVTSRMFIVNYPISSSRAAQFVFNTWTGAACQYSGLDALCWGIYGDRIFFGTADGRLVEADVGVTDDGLPIDGDVIQAFNYMGSPGQEKAFKRVSPIFVSSANPAPSVQVYTDFNLARFTATPSQPLSTDSLWGVARWGVDKWGSVGRVWQNWIPCEGHGRTATVRIRIRTLKGRPSWMATNWNYITGGSL